MGTAQYRQVTLKGKRNFDRLFANGKYHRGETIALLVRDAEASPGRFAICISKKHGTAARRNRLRRITRESLDPLILDAGEGFHAAVFPAPKFETLSLQERRRVLRKLLRRAGLIEVDRNRP